MDQFFFFFLFRQFIPFEKSVFFSGQQEVEHVEEHLVIISFFFYCLTEEGHVRPKIFNNQPFRVSTSDELEKREGAGTLFVQPINSSSLSSDNLIQQTFSLALQSTTDLLRLPAIVLLNTTFIPEEGPSSGSKRLVQ